MSIKHSDDNQVCVKTFYAHPRERRQDEVVNECRQDGTRYPFELGVLVFPIKDDNCEGGDVQTKECGAKAYENPVGLGSSHLPDDLRQSYTIA